ncbi:MAG: hypothetical protein QG656_2232 [Candidatus Hydrogenedentes bacterium]|nr:hypothetical protein [Candidatus Hydrogenedentota bacterium]
MSSPDDSHGTPARAKGVRKPRGGKAFQPPEGVSAMEEALRDREQRLHNLADNLSNAMVYQLTAEPDGGRRFTYVSRSVERLNEVTREQALADADCIYKQVLPEYLAVVKEREMEALESLSTMRVEVQNRLPSGRLRWFEYTSTPRRLADGLLVWDGVEVDITEHKQVEEELERRVAERTAELTEANLHLQSEIEKRGRAEAERRNLEAQVQHAQKLESLGVLAGGIAHDFNNILQLILSNAHHARKLVSETAPARPYIDNIEKSVNRASVLTRQMLAYSGKGHLLVQALDVAEIAGEIVPLIQSSVSKKVVIRMNLAENLPRIEGDAAQLQQVAMNLIMNAAEAIDTERGGTVTVSATALMCDEELLRGSRALFDAPAAEYVCLEVTDTGCGMSEDTKERLFDPFFTTKFAGRGLGMSAALGIVRAHRGAILVQSAPGAGTTIRVLFPVAAGATPEDTGNAAESPSIPAKSAGVLLFVEDEPDMRDLGALALEQMGYTVLTALDGLDALDIFRAHSGEIDCVLLDLSMPRMDGVQTLLELRRIKPDIHAVIASGYPGRELEVRLAGQKADALIEKPYDFRALSAKLQAILG